MSERHPEIVLPEDGVNRELARRTRRDFLIGGLAGAAAIGGYEWVTRAKEASGVPWPQRRVLEFNGRLARGYVRPGHLMPTYSRDRVAYLKPNGNIGMDQPIDSQNWQIKVDTGEPALNLSLADVKVLPKFEMITQFCCIEGWSTVAYWGGARFSDFTQKYFRAGAKLPEYVYMATPGEDYYVGVDIESAMHPQTLLAYEQNGTPLEAEHGAPLRLVIPVKYGIKNIKRIGLIQYTNERPADYWAEEGYDWFAGL
ncbi:MAG: molybdopterin-dependent oxidoreductase [Acidobacteriaceae bacterium]|nr:molybdopterin-dependent oxidoreductase [Acidobacteriaceae bacterium]